MKNSDVAEQLLEIADLLDVLGERFKPEAYRRAARSIESLAESVEEVAARNGLRAVPGIGEAIDEKVRELLRTGSIPYLEKLRRSVPPGLRELMRLPGLGPKTARRFWVEFSIEGPAELDEAIRVGRLQGAKGFGDRKIAQLSAALAAAATSPSAVRLPIEAAYPLARSLLRALRASSAAQEVAIAGSFRRGRETVGDLDVLVTSAAPEEVFDVFSKLAEVREVRLRGPTKETVVLHGGLQVDLRVVEPAAFGAALQYFTGSKDHNVRLRSLARDRGLKINEYGVFRGEERVGGRTEEELYGLLDLAWIPPELREDRGEIALAQARKLPKLVEASDLRGDLHVHLPAPVGPNELETILADADRRKLDYLGVVVAGQDDQGGEWLAPPATRELILATADRRPRVLAVGELRSGTVPTWLGTVALQGLVVRPEPSVAASTPDLPLPVLALAHFEGRLGQGSEATLTLARALSAAVEIGPGSDRGDSGYARAAREAGVAMHLPTAVGEPPESATFDVALAFARRAGAERSNVRNARPFPEPSGAVRKSRPPGRSGERPRRR